MKIKIVQNRAELLYFGIFFLVCVFTFSFVGIFVPAALKQRDIENTEYYDVIGISIEEKDYKPCESMSVTITRNALQDLAFTSVRQLDLVKVDGFEEIYQKKSSGIAEQGQYKVTSTYELPCLKSNGTELETGQYFWQISIDYKINGREKTEFIRTPYFQIQGTEEVL